MLSYLTIIDKRKAETVLFKMGLCLWICRDSKILKACYIIGRTYNSKVTNMYHRSKKISTRVKEH